MTTHPATCAMVEYYAAWYDRHVDPEWRDLLLMPPDATGERIPVAFLVPQSSGDLRRMGRSFASTIFPSAGNVTHTPAYGNLIALGILDAVQRRNPSSENVATAAAYRDWLARTGRFLTFSAGGATIGARFREDPNDRASLRLIKATEAHIMCDELSPPSRQFAIIISPRKAMSASPPPEVGSSSLLILWRSLTYAWFTCGRSSKTRCASVLDPANMTSPAVSLLVRDVCADLLTGHDAKILD
jgi:4-hydroxyphenylacetate 3-hydroxylase N terminal